MNPDILLTAFPATDDESLYWWHVADGAVQAWGCDPDPLTASQAYGPDSVPADVLLIALVPSHLTSVMGHEAIEGATESQALAAARMATRRFRRISDLTGSCGPALLSRAMIPRSGKFSLPTGPYRQLRATILTR